MSITKQLADQEYVQGVVDDVSQSLKADLDTKRDIVNLVTSPLQSNSLVLVDNTEYRLTDISSLALTYPDGNFEVWISISFSQSESIAVAFPAETRYIGATPSFANSETWEISIKDGVAVCWRVE